MAKDTVIKSLKLSPTLMVKASNCDIKMENGTETNLKDKCNINNQQDFNDKSHNEDEKDISEPQGIKISEQMGCNYENDLQNGLVNNTDKVGANRTEFYFETDHDALRGNPDYLTVLKTL